ncbi:MAG: sensor histidine kinase [Gemmatimonadales bacterium]
MLLTAGLVVAVLLAVFVELLARRQRYAQELVAERTAELVAAQRTMVRQERLAAIGEMASVVSHELRNPLSAVVNDLFLVRHGLGDKVDAAAERHLSNAEREVFRAARLSEDLLAYTREREPQRATVQVDAIVAEVLESGPPPAGVEVRVESSVEMQADPALMNQVVTNLLTNAYQAMPDGGTVRVAARRSGGTSLVSVEDAGPGFDPDIAPKLFDAFFTTKDGGTGLGLAIVQRLVEAHDGTVSMENVPGGGARVTVEIPDGGAA